MNVRYCPRSECGAKTEYTITKPAFCSKCGRPFEAAFAGTSPPVVSPPVVPTRPPYSPPVRQPRYRSALEHHTDDQEDEFGSDHYDENEMLASSEEMAAVLDGSGFLAGLGNLTGEAGIGAKSSVKFGQLVQEAGFDVAASRAAAVKAEKKGSSKPRQARAPRKPKA